MTDRMRNWLGRGGIALVALVVGVAAGWVCRGLGQGENVFHIAMYQDWRLACPSDADAKGSCQLATELVDNRSGMQLAQISLERDLGKRTLVIKVPLTVLIPPGVGLQFGDDTKTFAYSTCSPLGCFAFAPLDDKLLASFGSAKSVAVVVTVAQNGKSATLPLSLRGYSDAIRALDNIEAKRHSWWRRLWT
ncbi:MAG TPA: invasion associated locus B family protein [Rhizomicrobium sp.]|nr:invasion associated locus B family protein [Rhizomicrobium sp.]